MLAVNAKSKLSEAESANVIAESAGATNAKSAGHQRMHMCAMSTKLLCTDADVCALCLHAYIYIIYKLQMCHDTWYSSRHATVNLEVL